MVFGLMFILMLISVLALTLGIETVYAAPQVNILTHSGWLDSVGCYHVSGEVENVGDSPAGFVKVTATFYDSSDTVVATSFSYTMLKVLLPGRKSPFDILLTDTTQAAKVHQPCEEGDACAQPRMAEVRGASGRGIRGALYSRPSESRQDLSPSSSAGMVGARRSQGPGSRAI